VTAPASPERRGIAGVRLFAAGLALLLIVAAAVLAQHHRNLAGLERDNDALAREVCLLDVCCDQGEPIPGCERVDHEALAGQLERRLVVIGALDDRRRRLPARLAALDAALPPEVWLTRLELTDRVDLHGRSASLDGAAEAMAALQSSPCFDAVELVRTEARSDGEGQTFQLRAGLAEDCAATPPSGRDLFRPVRGEEEAPTPAPHRQIRWDLRAYSVTAIDPGRFAWLQDPEGGTWQVAEGSVVGDRGARVTVVTDDSVIFTWDEVLDEETGEATSRIVTLRLEQPGHLR